MPRELILLLEERLTGSKPGSRGPIATFFAELKSVAEKQGLAYSEGPLLEHWHWRCRIGYLAVLGGHHGTGHGMSEHFRLTARGFQGLSAHQGSPHYPERYLEGVKKRPGMAATSSCRTWSHPARRSTRLSDSILQVLPRSATPAEVIRWGARFREKLGTRAVGLNLN